MIPRSIPMSRLILAPLLCVVFFSPSFSDAEDRFFRSVKRRYAETQRSVPESHFDSADDVLELPGVSSENKCFDYCRRYPSCIDIAYDQRTERCRLRLIPFDSEIVGFDRHAQHQHQQPSPTTGVRSRYPPSPTYSYYDGDRRPTQTTDVVVDDDGTGRRLHQQHGGHDIGYNSYSFQRRPHQTQVSSPASSSSLSAKPHSRRHAVDPPPSSNVGEYVDASESVGDEGRSSAERFSTPAKLRQPFASLIASRPFSPAKGFSRVSSGGGEVDYDKFIVRPDTTNAGRVFQPARLEEKYSALPSRQVGASIVVRRPKRQAGEVAEKPAPASSLFFSETMQLTCGIADDLVPVSQPGRTSRRFEGSNRPSRRPTVFKNPSSGGGGGGRPPTSTGPVDGGVLTANQNPSSSTSSSPSQRPLYYSPSMTGGAGFRPSSGGTGPQSLVDDRFGKIIGGFDVPYGTFPWQAEIEGYSRPQRRWKHHCGGALVSQRHVLTAAHCVRAKSMEAMKVKLGDHRVDVEDSHETTYRVTAMVHHEMHRSYGPYSHDIGVLKLDKDVVFNAYVKPICLPQSEDIYVPGTWCTVSGWGLENPKDSTSLAKTLKAAKVPVIPIETCKRDEVYGKRSQKILPGMMCAGFLEGGIDACGGDSGGPLSCKINGRFVLLGLVSWGDGCARKDRPGVYVKVAHYLDWIKNAVDSL